MARETTQQEIDYSKTPEFDKACQNIAKYLAAGAQTFIPVACEALRNDWFPGVSDNGLRNNITSQKMIRQKVLDSLSNDRDNKTPWGDRQILLCFPRWLRNPVQEAANEEISRMGGEANRLAEEKLTKRNQLSEQLKSSVITLTKSLPETVIIPESKREYAVEDEAEDREIDTEFTPMGEGGRELMHSYSRINTAAMELWKALTEERNLPGVNDDIFTDHVKPTREYRNWLISELKNKNSLSLNSLQRNLAYVDHVLGDMLERLEKES